jgi:hypothetical protein
MYSHRQPTNGHLQTPGHSARMVVGQTPSWQADRQGRSCGVWSGWFSGCRDIAAPPGQVRTGEGGAWQTVSPR